MYSLVSSVVLPSCGRSAVCCFFNLVQTVRTTVAAAGAGAFDLLRAGPAVRVAGVALRHVSSDMSAELHRTMLAPLLPARRSYVIHYVP